MDKEQAAQEVLKEAFGSLPLAGVIRQTLEGVIEEHKDRIEGVKRQIVDPSYQYLKESADPLEFLVETAKLLAQAELLLRLDNEVREKVES